MNYYIEVGTNNKAKEDIDEICRQEGFVNLTRHNFGKGGVGRFLTKLVSVTSILWRLKQGDTLFLQYPMKKFYYMACSLAHLRGARVMTVIHDLGAFRRHKLTPKQENSRLSKTDFLIVHNPTMRDYLREHGFKGGIHCLQIFDYLSPSPVRSLDSEQLALPKTQQRPWNVVYGGHLGRWRNAFLYEIPTVMEGWEMDLYGRGFDAQGVDSPHLRYHGFKAGDDFIAQVEADFGLVWDGDSLDECTGDWGEYLRINDPHKTSFYLRAGIPVIVWSQAAMAPFILEQKVGISVDSLSQISNRLASISAAEFAEMKKNAVSMSRRLSEGYYIKEGFKAAKECLK
ncbi:MAG: galactofuranosyltransferase [Bacteroidaceae bacterium]|nr:galactofuranosyltransferase [Bacteroidaceae bacterium]